MNTAFRKNRSACILRVKLYFLSFFLLFYCMIFLDAVERDRDNRPYDRALGVGAELVRNGCASASFTVMRLELSSISILSSKSFSCSTIHLQRQSARTREGKQQEASMWVTQPCRRPESGFVQGQASLRLTTWT